MKRIIGLTLCIALLFCLMACSSPGGSGENADSRGSADASISDNASVDSSGSKELPEQTITLQVTSWRTDDAAYWEEINAAFHAENPGIEVVFNGVTATEYDSVLQTKLQSGNAEDILFLRTFCTGKQIYDAGYVLPLSESEIPNLAQIHAAYKTPWTDAEDGTVYGVPGSMCMGGFFYNKGIFRDAGIENPPETWDEFLEDCEKLEAAGYIAVADGIKDSWFITEYISSTVAPVTVGGSQWHERLMNKEVDWTDPGFVKSMEWTAQLAEHFPTGYEGIGYDDAQMLFLSEAAAIYPSGSFDLAYLQTTNPDIDLGWFFMPVEAAGDVPSINFNCIMGYGINAALQEEPEKLEAAYQYLNWLCGDTASSMFNNRIVGQYACNTETADDIENELAAEIFSDAKGGDLFQQMPYEGVSDSSPDYTTVVTQAIYDLLINGKSAEEVCETMVEQQAWYFNS